MYGHLWREHCNRTIAPYFYGSPGADSILLRSENGLDRYSAARDTLRAHLTGDFGDSIPVERFAVRHQGQLLSRLTKPAVISVCRQGTCREIYHQFPVELPEANHRTVALTGGYDAVFARRSLIGSHSTVLFREAPSTGIWSAQAAQVPLPGGERVSRHLTLSPCPTTYSNVRMARALHLQRLWCLQRVRAARRTRRGQPTSRGPGALLSAGSHSR